MSVFQDRCIYVVTLHSHITSNIYVSRELKKIRQNEDKKRGACQEFESLRWAAALGKDVWESLPQTVIGQGKIIFPVPELCWDAVRSCLLFTF